MIIPIQIVFQHVDQMNDEGGSLGYDLGVAFFSALIAFMGAWAIMKYQLNKEKKSQKEQEYQQDKDQLEHFLRQTMIVVQACEVRLKLITEYTIEQQKDHYEDAKLQRNTLNCLNRLLTDDPHELHVSLKHLSIDVDWSAQFDNYYKTLDDLQAIFSEIERIDDVRVKSSIEYKLKFQGIFEGVSNAIAMHCYKMSREHGNERDKIPEYQCLNEFLHARNEILTQDNASIKPLNVWNEKLLQPFLNDLLQLNNKDLVLNYAYQIKECRVIINFFKTNIENHIKEIERHIPMVQDRIDKLKEALRLFETIRNTK